MHNVLLIGIAGGSGSGKTALTRNIKEKFGDKVTVITHDDYYKAHDDMTYEQRALINYDEPAAYDTHLLVRDLKLLKSGQNAVIPVYDFTVHNRSSETRTVCPNSVIVVEGILILSDPELCKLFDIKVFVDTEPDIRIIRRIKRDMTKRARTFESIVKQYLTTVKPMHELYVEPSKKNADIIIQNGGKNPKANELLFNKIYNHIKGISIDG